MVRVVTFACALLVTGSCGSGSGESSPHGSCATVTGGYICTDYRSNDASEITTASSDCTSGSTDYQWSTGACNRGSIVGGCYTIWHKTMTGADLQELQWYYPDGPFKTASDLEAHCTALGSLFVDASFSFPPLPKHG